MKDIVIFIAVLLLSSSNMLADSSDFVELNAEFHTLTTDSINKNNNLCISCHLLEDSTNPDTAWLRPQETINTTVKNLDNSDGEPDSFSKACLSCHDGNEASLVLNAPISPCGIKSLASVSPNGANHPVFMTYTNKQGLHHSSSTLNGVWKEAKQVSDLLRDDKVVCISCHTPHHAKGTGYLKSSMRGSGLCMGCHEK